MKEISLKIFKQGVVDDDQIIIRRHNDQLSVLMIILLFLSKPKGMATISLIDHLFCGIY